ncbi:hypothetical protein [Methyloceanibacter caenitepidi]|nr:hypothetical protein [Methyloceanibacter caenitepidi]
MAILTGFLQDSLRVSKTVMPVMNRQGQKYTGKQIYFYDERPIEAVIATMVPGETLYIGYTATYAWDVNYRFEYLFVDLAAQQWPQIVKAVESEVIQKRGLR